VKIKSVPKSMSKQPLGAVLSRFERKERMENVYFNSKKNVKKSVEKARKTDGL